MSKRYPKPLDGCKFGRLLVLRAAGSTRHKQLLWECVCDCGKSIIVIASHLRSGHSRSCGCSRRTVPERTTLETPEYIVWIAMRVRCRSPKHSAYKYYGGRGIRVCERWECFETFLSDMGSRPSPDATIDRIDNDGNYEPGNCRWATHSEQQRNRRDSYHITYRGETKSIWDWAEEYGINQRTLIYRLQAGWIVERALTEPVRKRRHRLMEAGA